jgi:SAM-dependent methyltransferase
MYEIFSEVYDAYTAEMDYGRWASVIDEKIRAYLPGARSLIDLACGTGRMTLPLYEKGYQVIGMDASESMLMRAQEKAAAKRYKIPFFEQRLEAFSFARPVDVVTVINDGLNYLDDAALHQFFDRVESGIKSGGLLIVDLSTPYKLEHVLGDRTIAETREDHAFIWENHYEPGEKRLSFTLTLFLRSEGAYYERHEEYHEQHAHGADKIRQMASGSFDWLETIDGEQFTALSETSERMLLILRRK